MLEHLGQQEAADSLVDAIAKTTKSGVFTPDLGGNARTQEVAESIMNNLGSP